MIAHVTWGMGFDLYPQQTIGKQEAVLRAGYSREVAESFHARSRHSVGLRRKRRDRQDGPRERYNDPLFFGNFLVKLILLT
jgi:hypothetical protein